MVWELRGDGGHPWGRQGTGAGGRSTGQVDSWGRGSRMVYGDMQGGWVWQEVGGGTGAAETQIGGSWYCGENGRCDRARLSWLAGAGPRGTHSNAWRKLV